MFNIKLFLQCNVGTESFDIQDGKILNNEHYKHYGIIILKVTKVFLSA